jgi:hypothetical protein
LRSSSSGDSSGVGQLLSLVCGLRSLISLAPL